ncbi:SH3 domain-containing protein [Streptomyces synnematoformans]
MKMISRMAVSAITVGVVLVGAVPAVPAAPSSVAADRYARPMIKVTCSAANVRKKPRKSSPLVGVVHRGERVRLLQRTENWSHLRIRFKEGGKSRTGWIIFDCGDLYRQ